jgi:hypothetical protein
MVLRQIIYGYFIIERRMGEPMDIVQESPERMDTSPPHFIKTDTQKRGRRIKLKNAKDKKKQGKKNAKGKKTHTKKNVLALNEKKRKEEREAIFKKKRQAIFDSARGLNKHNLIWISHGAMMSQPLHNVPFKKFPYKKLLQYGLPGAFLATSDKNETIPQRICNKEYSYGQRTVPIKEFQSKYVENGETKTAFENKTPEWTTLPDYRFSVSEHDERNQIKNSMGLWYCENANEIKHIFTYDDILEKTKDEGPMTIHHVHNIMFTFCKRNNIRTDEVTVSIWACQNYCENNKNPTTKVPINVVNKKKGGGSLKKLPEPMSTEEMAQFLSVCVMPPKKKLSNAKPKTRTQTKTRKNNKKRT